MSQSARDIDEILADLNEQQREAVCHDDKPLLIVAGAGTGKTTTLARRVAALICNGVDPGRILLLTFTRRASAEMLRRVDGILRQLNSSGSRSKPASRKVWGGTFHAIATRLLRRYGKLIGLDPGFTIFDRGDAEDLLNVLRTELKLNESETRFPLKGTCLDIYSRCVNTQQRLSKVLPDVFPWCSDHEKGLQQLFKAYTERKEAQTVLDYDDLLLFWQALVADRKAGEKIRSLFDAVLVDEYQDTNLTQASILRGLCPDGTGLTVVGDDAQSIYSFRAATVRNILDFPQEYPGTTLVKLEQNYRTVQPILDATNRVIALAKERHAKDLWSARKGGRPPQLVDCLDEDEQTDFVIDRILGHREKGIRLEKQAVLFRASHHSLALELELTRRNIPFHKYGGLKFIETAHVKDLLAFLKLADNPRDVVAGLRVLLLLPGIGQKKASELLKLLATAGGKFAAWKELKVPKATAEYWPALVKLLADLAGGAKKKATSVSTELHRIRKFYAPLLERKYDHAEPRLRDLEQLEQIATKFSDRRAFLTDMTLDPPSSTQDLPADPLLDEEHLVLSTIHSAKGLEWDAVYVLHAADGNIPSDMATKSSDQIEEERRLFYVALTRAKDWLYVCYPARYYFPGRYRSDAHGFAQLTRFAPPQVQAAFDRMPADMGDEVECEADVSTSSVRESLGRMWS